MKKLSKITMCAVLLVVMVFTAVGCAFLNNDNENNNSNIPTKIASAVVFNSGSTERQKMDVVDAIEKVSRSVVAIKLQADENSTSYGSGIIVNIKRVDDDGEDIDGQNVFYILTCHHVIEGKGKITVYVPDEEGDNFGEHDYSHDYEFTGEIGGTFSQTVTLIGGDEVSDIALLKLDLSGTNVTSDKIVKANLAPESDYKMRVGESVFAIGNPSGTLPGSVTVGTIGYLNREVSIEGGQKMTLIQINTDIYHGSSGGALFNLYGEVIGVTNGGSDTYSGINYAIPFIVDAENGSSDNGFINITKQLLGTYSGKNFGYVLGRVGKFGFSVKESEGLLIIADVTEGSQADSVGIKTGDVINGCEILKAIVGQGQAISYVPSDRIELTSLSDLTNALAELKINDKIKLYLERVGRLTELGLTLTAMQGIFCDTGVY